MKTSYTLNEIRSRPSHVFSSDGTTAFMMERNPEESQRDQNGFVLVVLKRREHSWSVTATIIPREKTKRLASFGSSLVSNRNGTMVVISGPGYNNNQGRVWVYEDATPHSLSAVGCDGSVWVCEEFFQSPTVSRGYTTSQFGVSIAIDDEGNKIYVAAYCDDKERPYLTLYSFFEGLNCWKLKSFSEFATTMEIPLFDMDTDGNGNLVVIGATSKSDERAFFVMEMNDGVVHREHLVKNLALSRSGYSVRIDRVTREIVATPRYSQERLVAVTKFVFGEDEWVLAEIENTAARAAAKIVRIIEHPEELNYSITIKYLKPTENDDA